MAGFLFDFEEFLGEQTEIVADEKKYSLWQKSGDLYAPITSAKLVDKLQDKYGFKDINNASLNNKNIEKKY